jgi:hypothetical protein
MDLKPEKTSTSLNRTVILINMPLIGTKID